MLSTGFLDKNVIKILFTLPSTLCAHQMSHQCKLVGGRFEIFYFKFEHLNLHPLLFEILMENFGIVDTSLYTGRLPSYYLLSCDTGSSK